VKSFFLLLILVALAAAQQNDDPFAGVAPSAAKPAETAPGWKRFFGENFGFREELMFQFDSNQNAEFASRQSAGFEVQKKFSTATSTVASFDFQGRLVRRDGFNPVMNDMEGASRQGWAFEYHNLYADIYNMVGGVGRFNSRAGHFYVPFGLNLQTDTHGTVLQLSNDSNFGFERDWYAGFWGRINKHLNYDAYYLAGSGYDLKFKGQTGLAGVRLSLSNRYSSRYGIEGGVSVLAGERLAMDNSPIRTRRVGIDARYRRVAPRRVASGGARSGWSNRGLADCSSALRITTDRAECGNCRRMDALLYPAMDFEALLEQVMHRLADAHVRLDPADDRLGAPVELKPVGARRGEDGLLDRALVLDAELGCAVAEAFRVLLGDERRHAEDPGGGEQLRARLGDGLKRRVGAKALLHVDDHERGAVAAQQRHQPPTTDRARSR